MSDPVDKHLDKAFASLEDVPARELMATSGALERRKDSLGAFSGVFWNVASDRQGDWNSDLTRFHLGQAVERGGDELAEQIEDATAPFWGHVRDALVAERRPHSG